MRCQWHELIYLYKGIASTGALHHKMEAQVGVIVDGKDWHLCQFHADFLHVHPEELK